MKSFLGAVGACAVVLRPNVTVNCADRIEEQCVAAGSYPGYYEAVWTPTCYSHRYPAG
jgi:hypothetical protein